DGLATFERQSTHHWDYLLKVHAPSPSSVLLEKCHDFSMMLHNRSATFGSYSSVSPDCRGRWPTCLQPKTPRQIQASPLKHWR
ncbi:MAG: hypothetical protein ACI9VX_002085, partial [Dinoroseobacter sp.]